MEKLEKLSCEQFVAKLASEAPTPGGGGAAAVAGSLAASLSSMVCNLTIGKVNFALVEEEVKSICAEADALRSELLDLTNQDAAVFGSFMACYKLPMNSDEEKKRRLEAIHNAAKQAAIVPMNIARASAKVLKLAERIAVIGNPNVVTDATCSAILANAAMRCAFYNVYINLKLTKDQSFNEKLLAEIAELQKAALEAEAKVLAVTDEALA